MSYVFDVVNNIATENELPSTSAPSGVPIHLQSNMRNSMIDTDVSIMDSDKSHRPESHTRVAHAKRSVGDVDTCAKVPVTIPGTSMTKPLHATIVVRKVSVTIPTIGSVWYPSGLHQQI